MTASPTFGGDPIGVGVIADQTGPMIEERACLIGDDPHLDGVAAEGRRCRHDSSLAVALAVAPERELRRVVSAFCSRAGTDTSGGFPIFDAPLRLGELVATLALAQDNAFGQPLESQLRSCLLASWMCEAAGLDEELRATAYWVALLRFVGCTGHAHEVSTMFGDEIAIRGQTLVHDPGNPAEVMADIVAFATAGRGAEERDEVVRRIQETIREWAFVNFSSGCEVADVLLGRLDLGPDVREALACTFECWNGKGHPHHVAGG